MKENIKIGLLAAIAITLVIQTWVQIDSKPLRRGGINSTASNNSGTYDPNNPNVVRPDISNVPPSSVTPELAQKIEENNAFMGNRNSTTPPSSKVTAVNFETALYDFGSIDQNTENNYTFKFTNTGSEPLVIENARGSCGCTVPTYPEEPIPPGGTGEIEVVYKPGMQKGTQRKTVTVMANTQPRETILSITADVQELAAAN